MQQTSAYFIDMRINGVTRENEVVGVFFGFYFVLFAQRKHTNHSSTLLHIFSYSNVAKEFPNATTVLVLATGLCCFF